MAHVAETSAHRSENMFRRHRALLRCPLPAVDHTHHSEERSRIEQKNDSWASGSNQGVTIPAKVSSPSAAAETSIQLCVMSKSRRRSTTSARAPAGSASKTTGRLPAVSTSATSIGDVVKETISQDSPTSSIHVPILDATVAIQSARKI